MADNVSIEDAQRETRDALMDVADKLDTVQRRMDVGKLTVSSIGLTGAVLTILGLSLAPVTAGLTLGLFIAGGSLGVISCVGGVSLLVGDLLMTRKAISKAEKKLLVQAHINQKTKNMLPELICKLKGYDIEDLRQRIRESNEINKEMKECYQDMIKNSGGELLHHASVIKKTATAVTGVSCVVDDIFRLMTALSKSADTTNALYASATATGVAVTTNKVIGTAAQATTTGVVKSAAKVGLTTSKVVGVSFAGLGVGVDLVSIVYYAFKLKKNEPCQVATDIRKAANRLKLKMD